MLTKLVETGELTIPGLPSVRIDASLYPGSSRRVCTSSERWFPVRFSCFEYRWSIGSECQGNLPQRTFYSLDHPVYPGGKEAIEDLLKVRLGTGGGRSSDLVALTPDYRGRSSELRSSTTGVEVMIECLPRADVEDLIGKVYFEAPSGAHEQGTLEFNDQRATFQANTFPRRLVVVLLSRSKGALIDERWFNTGSTHADASVVVETTEQSIENLALAGESETVESKRELRKKREDLAVSISSLWNRFGGQILTGVDNDGRRNNKARRRQMRCYRILCRYRPSHWATRKATVNASR